MTTFHMTIFHFDEIRNIIPHGEPNYYYQDSILCVEVECDEAMLLDFASRNGWM